MKSLFNPTVNQEVIDRIVKLTSSTASQWGKMNVGQMLAHCGVGMQSALGDVTLERSLMGYLFGGIAKKRLVNEEPFKKNLPTAKEFVIADKRNCDEEKKNLIALVQRFGQGGPNGLTKAQHPFFGDMTPHEWDVLMWKHLDHHLRQFGV